MGPVFIGDEVTAAGYRLAGLEVRLAGPGEGAAALEQACREDPPLVLITAECAAGVPEAELARRLAALDPPLLVVADAAGRVPPPDVVADLRAQVGLT